MEKKIEYLENDTIKNETLEETNVVRKLKNEISQLNEKIIKIDNQVTTKLTKLENFLSDLRNKLLTKVDKGEIQFLNN